MGKRRAQIQEAVTFQEVIKKKKQKEKLKRYCATVSSQRTIYII